MRTAPPSIATMLGTTQLTLTRCAKIVLRDGTEMGFCDHDKDLVIPVENDQYGPLTYEAGHGIIVGDTDLQIGLEADNTEASFPIADVITRPNILSRRFHMAKVYTFDADWTQAVPLPLKIMAGHVAMARPERNVAVFEIRSQADFWNTVIGRLASPRCSADFGDEQCGATPINYACTVTDAISNMRFKVDLADVLPEDYFRFGEVEFLDGELGGTWPYEIVAYNASTKEVEVLSPMPGFPAVGDQLFLRNGCSKLKFFEDDLTIPTCATHQNQRRFRGLDQLPGSDRFLRFPIPGSPGE